MTGSHAGHDAVIGDEVIFCNGAGLAGHARIANQAFLSAFVVVHQFTWVGQGVMSQGLAGVSMHVPPFCTFANINSVVGLNVVGMHRNPALTSEDRRQVREAFRLTYRASLTPSKALEEMDECSDWGPAAGAFRDFLRDVIAATGRYSRGLCPMRRKARR